MFRKSNPRTLSQVRLWTAEVLLQNNVKVGETKDECCGCCDYFYKIEVEPTRKELVTLFFTKQSEYWKSVRKMEMWMQDSFLMKLDAFMRNVNHTWMFIEIPTKV